MPNQMPAKDFFDRVKAIADDLFDDNEKLHGEFIDHAMTKKGYKKTSSWTDDVPVEDDKKVLNFGAKSGGNTGAGWQYGS